MILNVGKKNSIEMIGDDFMLKIENLLYKGKVKIISLPKRQLSSESEYPELLGLEGKVARVSGNRVGVIVDNKNNQHSEYGCYWFDVECLEFV